MRPEEPTAPSAPEGTSLSSALRLTNRPETGRRRFSTPTPPPRVAHPTPAPVLRDLIPRTVPERCGLRSAIAAGLGVVDQISLTTVNGQTAAERVEMKVTVKEPAAGAPRP